jgi:hypothetical protein
MDRLVEKRIARNNATFREANERIGVAAGLYRLEGAVPFICECADPACSEIVRLELSQYEEVRADSRHFLYVPGHETAAQGAAVVVANREGYVIVEKVGHAGDVSDALDERTSAEGRAVPSDQ